MDVEYYVQHASDNWNVKFYPRNPSVVNQHMFLQGTAK
jgi:hypothetical protein